MSKIFGIDISTWQRNYPYKSATKEGVKFAILRAGCSRTKDNMFEKHYKNAKKQGWGVGAYWYTYATTVAEAKLEIKAFLKAIKGKKFEYPIYLDIEDASLRKAGKTTLNNIVKEYANAIQKAGYYFGVYTNVDWYRNKISGAELNKKYDWWIASWTSSKPSGINAGMWQFGGSSNAIRSPKIAGVTTDQDYAYKDYPSIIKKLGKNGYAKVSIIEKIKNKVKPKKVKHNLTKTLKVGSKGKMVEILQKQLGGLVVDGIFGEKTEAKVKQFQKKHKLTVDGIVGKNTAHKLGWLWCGK